MYEEILSQIAIAKMQLKNRAVVAPMTRISTKGDGVPTVDMVDYYSRYSKGGFGMIITEGTYTDRHYSQAYPNQPGITTLEQFEGWVRVVDKVKQNDSKIILQLMHAGALSQHLSNTRAPSSIEPMRIMLSGYSRKQGRFPLPQAMNLAEIDQVVEGFLSSALKAKTAGFDGVEIHSANGYLLDQFITDYTNNREDFYGGSLTNRIKLTCDIISTVREATGTGFTVGVRLSQGKVNDFDYMWSGGLTDAHVIFRSVAKAGASYIHFASEGKGFEHGCYTRKNESLPKYAKEITEIPVIANGGLHNPELATQLLREGHADLIALGTGALANPDWPQKLANNKLINNFATDMFKYGVDILAQQRYESEVSEYHV